MFPLRSRKLCTFQNFLIIFLHNFSRSYTLLKRPKCYEFWSQQSTYHNCDLTLEVRPPAVRGRWDIRMNRRPSTSKDRGKAADDDVIYSALAEMALSVAETECGEIVRRVGRVGQGYTPESLE